MGGVIPPLPLCASMAWTGTTLPIFFFYNEMYSLCLLWCGVSYMKNTMVVFMMLH